MRGGSLVLAAAFALVLTACGDTRRSDALGNAPELTSAEASGERIFMRHCNSCHVGGASALGPAINDKPLPGWLIKLQVRNGLGAMPSFDEEEISEQDLDDLTAYLRTRRRGAR